jgi:Flp pilus assembly protein CpaB
LRRQLWSQAGRARWSRSLWFRTHRHWPVTALLALTLAGATAALVSRAEQVAAGYGDRRLVPVATRELRPGERLEPNDLDWRELPVAAIPPTVIDADPSGRTVIEPILADEPVATPRLAPEGVDGPAALTPPGTRALAVPVDPPLRSLAVGDRVDLLALGKWVARDAVVVDVDEGSIVVAVDEHEAPAVARGVLDGSVVPALVSPGR